MPEQDLAPEKKVTYTGNTVKKGEIKRVSMNIPMEEQINNKGEGAAAAQPNAGEDLNDTEKANIAAGLNKDGSKKDEGTGTELTAEIKAANLAKGLNEDGTSKADTIKDKPVIDDAAVLEYLKSKGKEITSLDEITNPTKILSDEEKQKQAEAFEKRMLDLYVQNGGKIDQFALLKQIAATDLTELSKVELTKELKAQGFNETEIAAIQKERYYQLEQAEIDAIEDPEEKAFAQKKLDYGKKKLEGKAAHIKENAVDFFNNLKEALNQKDAFTQKESEFVSNVETHFKEVPRKLSIELGKVGDADVAPVEYDIPEEVITSAKETLKNITSRKQLLFNTDGTLNLNNIAELVLKGKMFDSAAKTAYLEGGSREVEKFEKLFPMRSAQALGVGGGAQNKDGKPGKIVKAGQVQRFKQAVAQ